MDPCERCHSVRVVLVSVLEDVCGKNWRDAFRDEDDSRGDTADPEDTSRPRT